MPKHRVLIVDLSLKSKNGHGNKQIVLGPEFDDADKETVAAEKLRIKTEWKTKNAQWKLDNTVPKVIKLPDYMNRAGLAAPIHYATTPDLKLDPGTGNTVLLCASSKAGKTELMMALYKKYFTKYISIMFAHNSQIPQYNQKNLIVTDEFEPDIIEIERKLNKISKNKFDFMNMFDDMLKVKTETITDMFLSLRNSNISSMISLQYVNLLSKACRGNVNTIFGGSMNSDENILVFIKCYLSSYMHGLGLKSDGDMIMRYRQLTANHGFINIHPSTNTVSFVRLRL